ncbi:tetratricopeptide repeat protein 28-like isoform X2 [Hypanus sabinus]|uniref:tetratricopeptide repeat protein 28-like isoform X2 n=1 Tax=Hypanus sabinus TaxID=79690 RepID=UPI0028C4B11B|nr:tetratricopeptide repeat protein 28-like isoform X2 [Hypanus sabinus]
MIVNVDQTNMLMDAPHRQVLSSGSTITDSQKVACLQVQGDEALTKANYQEAVHSYTQGLMLDPKNCELLSCRAVAFIQMKQYEDARFDGEILIQIQPDVPQNYYLLSLANGCLGNFHEAFWPMLHCLERDPVHQNDLVKELYKITKKLCNNESDENYCDDKGLDEVLLKIGTLLFDASLYDLCIQLVSSAIQLYNSTMSDSIRMQFYLVRANSYSALNGNNMTKTAYENCLKLAMKLNSTEVKVKCCEGLAELHRKIGCPEEAIQYLLELLAIWEQSAQQPDNYQSREFWNSESKKAAYLNLTEAYCIIHQYQKALIFAKKYLEHLIGGPPSDCRQAITYAYHQVAKLQEKLGLYNESVNNYQRYCELSKVLGNSIAAAEAHGAMGSIHAALGNYDLAMSNALQGFNLSRAVGDRQLQLAALIRLGDISRMMESFKEATSWYEQAWDHNRMGDEPKLKCQTALGLAEVYKGTGLCQHALYFYEQALEAAEEIDEDEQICKCKFIIACRYQFSYSERELRKGYEAFKDVITHYHRLSRKYTVEGNVLPEEITDVLLESYDGIQAILEKMGDHLKALQYAEAGRRHRFLMYTFMKEEHSAGNSVMDQSLLSAIPSLEELYSIMDATSGSVLYYSLVETGLFVWMLKAKEGLVYFHATNSAVSEAVYEQICQFLHLLKNKSLLYETEARNIPKRLKQNIIGKQSKRLWIPHSSCKNPRATCRLPEDEEEMELWKQMYLLLFGPVNDLLDDLQPGSTILIIPDKNLIQIPFANLPDLKNKTLGEKFWITLAPSLFAVEVIANLVEDSKNKTKSKLTSNVRSGSVSTMTMLEHMGGSQQELSGLQKVGLMDTVSHLVHCTSTNTIVASSPYIILPFKQVCGRSQALVLGSPHFPSALSLWGSTWKPLGPLVGAQKEVIKVAEYLQAEAVMGEQATKKRVLSELPQLTVVHIATYGSWEEGVLLFTPHPYPAAGELVEERSYLLTIPEILELNLKAKVVVLSSCGDGGTSQDPVPPLILPTAFLRAGASTVLMQIKSVPLQASLTFYHHFYMALWYGSFVSYAVEYAKHQMQSDDRFRKYWSSFVLLGLDAFVSLQDIKHDMLHQNMESAEQEVAQTHKKDWLNPTPYVPPDRCTVKLTTNIISIPGIYSMLQLLGFHFQPFPSFPPKVDKLTGRKAANADVVKDCAPTFAPASPVAILFPQWNPERLIQNAQQVIAAVIDLSASNQCINALIWILPLTCDVLEQLITLLEISQSSTMMCPKLTEKGVAALWNQPHLRDFLQVIGYEQAGLFLVHNPRTPNKSLLLGSLKLFLALHPQSPRRHCKVGSSTAVRVQEFTQVSQETPALREDQSTQSSQETSPLKKDQTTQGLRETSALRADSSTQSPQETLVLREDQSTQSSQESLAQSEDLYPQGPQGTWALTYEQMKQGSQESLSADEKSSPRSEKSPALREEQSLLRGKKGGMDSQETPFERTRKVRQGPQEATGDTVRDKKTEQGPQEPTARKNMRNRHRPSETSLTSDKLSEQEAQQLTGNTERKASGSSKVCLNSLKPLLVLRHQIMMQAPWFTVRPTSEEVQVKRCLALRLTSLHSQQRAHIRNMELWHKKTLQDLECKPERRENKTQACGIKKVKVKGPSTPSSNRTPLDAPAPVSQTVAHNLALRSVTHEVVKEREASARRRHRAELRDLFLPFVDAVPDSV